MKITGVAHRPLQVTFAAPIRRAPGLESPQTADLADDPHDVGRILAEDAVAIEQDMRFQIAALGRLGLTVAVNGFFELVPCHRI